MYLFLILIFYKFRNAPPLAEKFCNVTPRNFVNMIQIYVLSV